MSGRPWHRLYIISGTKGTKKKFFFFFFFYVPHMILCFSVRLWRSRPLFLFVPNSHFSQVYHLGPAGLPETMDICLCIASCLSKSARLFVPTPHGRQKYFVSGMSPLFASRFIFFLCAADFLCFFRVSVPINEVARLAGVRRRGVGIWYGGNLGLA